MQATTILQMFIFTFMTALVLVPYLMLEEKQTRPMDTLLVSPATAGQVVLGKALAGALLRRGCRRSGLCPRLVLHHRLGAGAPGLPVQRPAHGRRGAGNGWVKYTRRYNWDSGRLSSS